MRRERIVAGTLVAVVVATLLAALAVPGVLTDRTENEPEAEIAVEEISIGADDVGGERLTLSTDVRLDHSGGSSENVSVELRAVETDSGLTAARQTVDVGEVLEDRELAVRASLGVQRGVDYRIDVVVYQSGNRVSTGSKSIRGTGALTPGYPDSPVQFHRFVRYDLPVIEYSIRDADDESATLAVITYLTNSGELDAENLRLVVKARQVQSGIVATQRDVSVDSVGPSQTVRPTTELEVPAQYNYYLDAILWKDGVIVDTARAGASLDPTEQVPANASERDVELEVGDFESGTPAGEGDPTPTPTASDGDGPGLGVGGTLLALIAATLLLARQKNGGTQ